MQAVGFWVTTADYCPLINVLISLFLPAYMAPELLGIVDDDDDDGNGDSGHTVMESSTSFSYSSDIYAAGIVFNEIWTCTVPWSNLTHYSLVAHRVAKGKRPVLYVPQRDSVNEQELMNLIGSASTGCLSQNPFHRPAAALVYQELSRLLENEQHREEEDSLSSKPLQLHHQQQQAEVC